MKYSVNLKGEVFDFYFLENIYEPEVKLPKVENLFSDAHFIEAFQEIFKGIHHQIIVIKQHDEVIAQLYFQCMPFKGKELSTYIPQESRCFLSKTVEALVDLALERIHWNLAVLGNIFITGDDGQNWYKHINAKLKWEIVNEAVKLYSKKQEVDAVIISDLGEEQLPGSTYLTTQKFRKFEIEPDLRFYTSETWKNFDDYLQSLSSKYRVRANKVLEKSSEISIKTLSLAEIKAAENQLFSLYENVVKQADFKLAEIPRDYFSKMKKICEEFFELHGFYLQNELVAFVCYFKNYTCLNINFVGLDYSYNRSHSLYQRILYHCIEEGILHKKCMIHFGRTATEIKTAVGALPFKSYSFIRHNNKIPNIGIKPLTTYLKPEPFIKRNPFKATIKH